MEMRKGRLETIDAGIWKAEIVYGKGSGSVPEANSAGKEGGSWVIKNFKKETEGQASKMGWVIKKFKKRVEEGVSKMGWFIICVL